MKLIKFKKLSKEELLNELKPYINGYMYFSYPTEDVGRIIKNEYQLELFIEEHKDEYWFNEAIGYKINGNKLEFIWDEDTQARIDEDKKVFYKSKADFSARWGCE
jgi:hypothetical protein